MAFPQFEMSGALRGAAFVPHRKTLVTAGDGVGDIVHNAISGQQ
jgi:hypothetical protein